MFIFNDLARMFVLFTRECSRSVQEYRWPIVGQADSQGRSVNQCSARVLRAHMLQDSLPVHPRKPGAPLWMGNRNRRPQPGEELGSQLGQAGAFAAIGLATPSTRVLRIGFYVGSGTLRLRYRFRSITRARLGWKLPNAHKASATSPHNPIKASMRSPIARVLCHERRLYLPCRRREARPGSCTERGDLNGDVKGNGTSGSDCEAERPMRPLGTDCFVVVMKRGNARGAKGAGHRHLARVNRQREEPDIQWNGKHANGSWSEGQTCDRCREQRA
jgi:hypothetical protein